MKNSLLIPPIQRPYPTYAPLLRGALLPCILLLCALSASSCSSSDSSANNDCSDSGATPCGECVDSDGDTICDALDQCPGADDNGPDADGDGVADACDACAFFNDNVDADGDGSPDRCDLCPGQDDKIDSDGDGLPDACDPEPLVSDWMRVGTVGGLGVFNDIEPEVLAARFDQLKAQNVTIVEADSDLSEYSDTAAFEREMQLLERAAILAHERDMRLVWYYPALEVITTNGQFIDKTMFKEHPEWVQESITGAPNVFYGGLVFWVEDGAESAWMDPLTGYRQYFIDRVNRIAQTGVDGVWLDVPLYNDIVGVWPSHREEDRVRFLADTGQALPASAQDSPEFWEWIRWRHQIIDEFLSDIHREARIINPDFSIIVENVTVDNNAALLEGLDGSFGTEKPGYWSVWEIDVLSETNSMVNSHPDDWVSLLAMYKYGRGASSRPSSWSFSYGLEEADAEAVMAACVITQNNPYELKTPEMTTTVGPDYRSMMFGWIQDHQDLLYRSESAARVAVIHSSSSRDYIDGRCMLDGSCGTALFASWEVPPDVIEGEFVWWTNSMEDSIYAAKYTAEYKGVVKALSHLHEPFDVLPISRVEATGLAKYSMVIAPSLTCLSDSEAQELRLYIQNGGHVLFTGSDLGTRNESAALRTSSVISDLVDDSTLPQLCSTRMIGAGDATYCKGNPGKEYFVGNTATALDIFSVERAMYSDMPVVTNAATTTHVELYRRGGKLALQLLNYAGADGSFSVVPQTINVQLDVSELPSVSRVIATSPHDSKILPFTIEGSTIHFEINIDTYLMVLVEP